jgi:hypothetical protein
MISSSIKELNDTKVRIAKLELAAANELASLPSVYGFDSLKVFVAAIKAAGGRGRAVRPTRSATPKIRKRAKITDVVRAKVKKLVKAGKTGRSIAEALGISLPSVQNIKKASGLVNSRKKAAPKSKNRRQKAKVKTPSRIRKTRVVRKKAPASVEKPTTVPVEAAPPPSAK